MSPGISGRICNAELRLLENSQKIGGVRWFANEEDSEEYSIVYENRTTTLIHKSGKKIMGVEHLSAAALAFSESAFSIDAPQNELPLLNGSAEPWFNYLSDKTKVSDIKFYKISDETKLSLENRYACITPIHPAPSLPYMEVTYSIDRFGYKSDISMRISKTQDLFPVYKAQTFIFEDELSKVKLPENLMNCGKVLNPATADKTEPLLHKILDLLGDISVRSPHLPIARLRVHNGGHELHHLILESLPRSPSPFEHSH